ncbi:MAG: hypothetical protein ACRYE7_02240 [Janthinobacterium lividum]
MKSRAGELRAGRLEGGHLYAKKKKFEKKISKSLCGQRRVTISINKIIKRQKADEECSRAQFLRARQ